MLFTKEIESRFRNNEGRLPDSVRLVPQENMEGRFAPTEQVVAMTVDGETFRSHAMCSLGANRIKKHLLEAFQEFQLNPDLQHLPTAPKWKLHPAYVGQELYQTITEAVSARDRTRQRALVEAFLADPDSTPSPVLKSSLDGSVILMGRWEIGIHNWQCSDLLSFQKFIDSVKDWYRTVMRRFIADPNLQGESTATEIILPDIPHPILFSDFKDPDDSSLMVQVTKQIKLRKGLVGLPAAIGNVGRLLINFWEPITQYSSLIPDPVWPLLHRRVAEFGNLTVLYTAINDPGYFRAWDEKRLLEVAAVVEGARQIIGWKGDKKRCSSHLAALVSAAPLSNRSRRLWLLVRMEIGRETISSDGKIWHPCEMAHLADDHPVVLAAEAIVALKFGSSEGVQYDIRP